MQGPVFTGRGLGRGAIAAALIAMLTACTTLPSPPPPSAQAAASGPTAPAPEAAASAAAPASSPRSRLSDFISRRLLRRPEAAPPPPVPEVLAAPEAPATPDVQVDEKYRLTGEAAKELERGHASWYGGQFHGRRTASGENYDKYALTAAHKTLPFGTIVRVRSLKLGREVDVRINDRGPFAPGRVIDVSQAAAEALGLMGKGVAEVSLKVADTVGAGASSRRATQKSSKKTQRPARPSAGKPKRR